MRCLVMRWHASEMTRPAQVDSISAVSEGEEDIRRRRVCHNALQGEFWDIEMVIDPVCGTTGCLVDC